MKYPTPLADRVIILPEKEQGEEKGSGFFTPDELKPKGKTGIVKAVGKGYVAKDTGVLIPMEVSVGDRILYGRVTEAPITIEGVEHIIVKQDEIILKN